MLTKHNKFFAIVVSLSMLFLPAFIADQVPATEAGVNLDKNTIVTTYKVDVDMISIQSPATIIINPSKDFM